jgi:hypothetical protein
MDVDDIMLEVQTARHTVRLLDLVKSRQKSVAHQLSHIISGALSCHDALHPWIHGCVCHRIPHMKGIFEKPASVSSDLRILLEKHTCPLSDHHVQRESLNLQLA